MAVRPSVLLLAQGEYTAHLPRVGMVEDVRAGYGRRPAQSFGFRVLVGGHLPTPWVNTDLGANLVGSSAVAPRLM
jgi:hypothetical protein